MFTGLVQAVGTIHRAGKKVLVEVPTSFPSIALGDSIAVDGVCLTVAALRNKGFFADVSEETLARTSLGEKATERGFVNLEPALRISDRLGGHFVSGHIDGLGKVVSIKELTSSWDLQIRWQENIFAKYTCDKASIALNGVSLTIAKRKEGNILSIAVIPHTWANTSLQYLLEGEFVNLEADLIAKYTESLLEQRSDMADKSNQLKTKPLEISDNWLKANGYS
ncbi:MULTISPECIES: riboflavin synthase [Prochlorococcus]|uniref:Riboflavin synthase n=1 Tax=Prochlorococcus marinus (strain SARG / CCMP1375 / SS120) TaxID=167539 RepID=Q7VDE1_PROMA|nr:MULTISPECIES: riboflavin synthase [Prochlorococcus]AAP99484.1 Riboflavin synthase alpha chain [Prochlorococcus marinus subsp. marinus str. CCMP1375]KGG11246.1 Riboflavin synthase eubacterial/eukaryotic [Prochlorococcus marinus str. LG]KGG21585.1 Riboflavin synthase eubacterial/eukaryotic [Prochlorococcus marinus str. SS2]KGG23073.1 Riboflavin synthase eubacterial/eukaryotic [Prochlorococcus marinus str. SS35]KGG33780.1 Riboflavin synthase eubacterial/eukaryotic [Prochlorococcus marinus str.